MMSLPTDSHSTISLQKPNGSVSNQPPELPPTDHYGNLLPRLLASPRQCSAGVGISWITQAFALFKDQFLVWLGIGVVYLIISVIGGSIPILNFIFPFISLVFIGGIIKGCDAQATDKELRFDHLFSAFNTHLMPLVILFLLYLVAILIVMIPLAIMFGVMFFIMGSSDPLVTGQLSNGMLLTLLFTFLVAMLVLIPIFMTIWFAPALVVLHDVAPVDAMKMSFKGCMKNILPFLVFGLVGPLIALLLSIFTLGLALLVLFPIGMITYYTSYRDVWTDRPLSSI